MENNRMSILKHIQNAILSFRQTGELNVALGKGNKKHGSISIDNEKGLISINGYNQPLLAVKHNIINEALTALRITSYADKEAFFRLWVTTDIAAISQNDQQWISIGDIDYIKYNIPSVANPMTFDTSKASVVFGAMISPGCSIAHDTQFKNGIEIEQDDNTLFVFTLHRDNGAIINGGMTYEYAITN